MSSSIICRLGPQPVVLCELSRGRRSLILLNYFKAPEIQASASRGLLLLLLEMVTGARESLCRFERSDVEEVLLF